MDLEPIIDVFCVIYGSVIAIAAYVEVAGMFRKHILRRVVLMLNVGMSFLILAEAVYLINSLYGLNLWFLRYSFVFVAFVFYLHLSFKAIKAGKNYSFKGFFFSCE